jgi:hypothetical protein
MQASSQQHRTRTTPEHDRIISNPEHGRKLCGRERKERTAPIRMQRTRGQRKHSSVHSNAARIRTQLADNRNVPLESTEKSPENPAEETLPIVKMRKTEGLGQKGCPLCQA